MTINHIEVRKIGERHGFVHIVGTEVFLQFARGPEAKVGTVEYAEGFGRYVARTASGKLRQFEQGNKDTGFTVIKRAARWIANNA